MHLHSEVDVSISAPGSGATIPMRFSFAPGESIIVTDLAPGPYSLSLSAPGYLTSRANFTSEAKLSQTLSISLEPSSLLEVQLIDEKLRPVVDRTVLFYESEGPLIGAVEVATGNLTSSFCSDESGWVKAQGMPLGRIFVELGGSCLYPATTARSYKHSIYLEPGASTHQITVGRSELQSQRETRSWVVELEGKMNGSVASLGQHGAPSGGTGEAQFVGEGVLTLRVLDALQQELASSRIRAAGSKYTISSSSSSRPGQTLTTKLRRPRVVLQIGPVATPAFLEVARPGFEKLLVPIAHSISSVGVTLRLE